MCSSFVFYFAKRAIVVVRDDEATERNVTQMAHNCANNSKRCIRRLRIPNINKSLCVRVLSAFIFIVSLALASPLRFSVRQRFAFFFSLPVMQTVEPTKR